MIETKDTFVKLSSNGRMGLAVFGAAAGCFAVASGVGFLNNLDAGRFVADPGIVLADLGLFIGFMVGGGVMFNTAYEGKMKSGTVTTFD